MSLHPKTDLSSNVKLAIACSQATAAGVAVVLTAGATEDGVKVTGQTVDRLGYDSCIFALGDRKSVVEGRGVGVGGGRAAWGGTGGARGAGSAWVGWRVPW